MQNSGQTADFGNADTAMASLSDVRDAPTAEEELRADIFAFFTHELANISAPLALISSALKLNVSAIQTVAVAETISGVATQLTQLTRLSRVLQGDGVSAAQAAPQTLASLTEVMRPLLEHLLPGRAELSIAETAMPIEHGVAARLAQVAPVVCRYLHHRLPAKASSHVTIRPLMHSGAEGMEFAAESARLVRENVASRRWLGHLRTLTGRMELACTRTEAKHLAANGSTLADSLTIVISRTSR
jgi:hypothetical protein